MKQLAPQDRPREKLERAGVDTLGDNELLAILIGHGTATVGALDVANHLLAAAGGIHGLTRLHRDELADIPGVGAAIAARIIAGVELGRRTLTLSPAERPHLATPQETAGFLLPRFGAFPIERLGVLLVDARHRLLRTRLLSSGSLDATVAHPRDVFREAMLAAAAGVIVFHNHPSGDARPSPDDYLLTRRLAAAGELMGIDLVDHLILADNTYFSFREKGRLEWPG
jgi:DNA repair protein RadC